jgi:hypothetical protein
VRLSRPLPPCVLALAMAGCRAPEPPRDFDHVARTFLAVLAQDQLDSALALCRFEGNPDTVRIALEQGSRFIAPFAIDSAQLVGWNIVSMNDTRADLTYEAHAGPRWAVLQIQVLRSEASYSILGFRWQPSPARLADLNAFTLRGRPVADYPYLVLAIASLLACLGGAVVAGVRRMGLLWVLFCLIGIGKATINWTTGQQTYNPLSFQILGIGFFRPGIVAPWFVSWSLPLGTILVLLKSRSRRNVEPAPEPTVAA